MKRDRDIQKLKQRIAELDVIIEKSRLQNTKITNLQIQKLEYEDKLSELLFE